MRRTGENFFLTFTGDGLLQTQEASDGGSRDSDNMEDEASLVPKETDEVSCNLCTIWNILVCFSFSLVTLKTQQKFMFVCMFFTCS